MTSEDPIPVRKVEKEMATGQPNGTIIEIEEVHLRALDQAGIIHYIERHLAKWPKTATVTVNNHWCEFEEPPVTEEKRFRAEGTTKDVLGDVELVIKVSKAPLEQDLRGISILATAYGMKQRLRAARTRKWRITYLVNLKYPNWTTTSRQSLRSI